MEPQQQKYFAIIIGAGASGLAAGKYLHSLGKSYLVLEAQDRIGGRVWTETSDDSERASSSNLKTYPYPIERGGEFLHGSTIATNLLAQAYDSPLVYAPRFRPDHMWWCGDNPEQTNNTSNTSNNKPAPNTGRAFALSDKHNLEERALLQRIERDIDEVMGILQSRLLLNLEGQDQSLEDFLFEKGYSSQDVEKANVLFAQTNCVHLSEFSMRDYCRDFTVDRSGPGEFRATEGMQTLLKRYSEKMASNISLSSEVTRIEWKPRSCRVTVRKRRGAGNSDVTATYLTERVLVTIPMGALQATLASRELTFTPSLPSEKLEAIGDFQMRAATKAFFFFAECHWDARMVYMAHLGKMARWWTPYYGLPERNREHCIVCFVTADKADYFDALTEAQAKALGLQELSKLLGKQLSEMEKSCTRFLRQCWAKEKYVRGGYAAPRVGTIDASYRYAEPVEKTLFFAGEATAYNSNTQTIHGAFDSGQRAACEMLDLAHARF